MASTWLGLVLGVWSFYCASILLFELITKPIVAPGTWFPHGNYVIRFGDGKYWNGWKQTEYLFVFGDSWTTTRFDPDGAQPTVDNPMGNPPWDPQNWHVDGSEIWIKFLTAQHNQSLIRTANLAHGGATVDLNLIHPYASVLPDMLDLGDQVDKSFHLYQSHPDYFPWTERDSLFIIWMGLNDIHNADAETSKLFPKIFVEYAEHVETLYQKGARNFLIIKIPPIEHSPLASKEDRVEDWTAWVSAWNWNLTNIARNLSMTHSDAAVFLLDTYHLFTDVTDNPCSFPETCELKDTTTSCDMYSFGTPDFDTKEEECEFRVDEYLWLNDIHPTTRMHNLTARVIADALMDPGKMP